MNQYFNKWLKSDKHLLYFVNSVSYLVIMLDYQSNHFQNTGPITLKIILDKIKSIIKIPNANGVKVIFWSILPNTYYHWRLGKNSHVKIPKLNAMIKGYTAQANPHYLDYFNTPNDGKNVMRKFIVEKA